MTTKEILHLRNPLHHQNHVYCRHPQIHHQIHPPLNLISIREIITGKRKQDMQRRQDKDEGYRKKTMAKILKRSLLNCRFF